MSVDVSRPPQHQLCDRCSSNAQAEQLANPGKEYVVELSPAANTTTVAVNVAQLPAGASLTATWYDLDTGTTAPASPVAANAVVTFTKPLAGLGVLLVE